MRSLVIGQRNSGGIGTACPSSSIGIASVSQLAVGLVFLLDGIKKEHCISLRGGGAKSAKVLSLLKFFIEEGKGGERKEGP